MEYQYSVFKYTNSCDWEESNTETICIAPNEALAKRIAEWLEQNDERFDEENITYEYGYVKLKTVYNLDSFIKYYDE